MMRLGWALAIGIYASFGTLVLCYQMWRAIDDGATRVSPVKAVTGLCVPVFSVYWLFRVFPGFVSEFNAHVRRHQLRSTELRSGWFIAFAVFTVGSSLHFVLAIPAIVVNVV